MLVHWTSGGCELAAGPSPVDSLSSQGARRLQRAAQVDMAKLDFNVQQVLPDPMEQTDGDWHSTSPPQEMRCHCGPAVQVSGAVPMPKSSYHSAKSWVLSVE